MVSGGLVSTGLVCAFFLWLLNRIFIVGLQSPTALLVLLFPMLLVAAGTTLAIRAIRIPGTVQTLRMFVGTLMVLAPLLVMAALPLFGVLLGSLGMDIHWNASRTLGGISALCLGIILCLSFIIGIRLLRSVKT
jgi:hypothetical protein